MKELLVILAIIVCGMGSRLGAQSPSAAPGDTSAIRVVIQAAVQALAADGLIEVIPRDRQPWRITAADSTSPTWRAALEHLYVLLHARPIASNDTMTRVLEFGPITVGSDSLSARFTIGLEWRCRRNGARHASTASRHIVAVRPQGWWYAPQVVETIIGDPPPC